MNFYKTTLFTVLSTGIKVLASLIVNKYIAVFFGPVITTAFGNFQNISQVLTVLSGGGITQGVTKYVSEFNDNPHRKKEVIRYGANITVLLSLVVSLLTIVFSSEISLFVFDTTSYRWLIVVSGFLAPFGALNLFFLSIINGLYKTKLFIGLNIAQSIVLLFTSLILMYFWEVGGAFLAIFVTQVISFFIIIRFFILRNFSLFFSLQVNETQVNRLSKYKIFIPFVLMTVTSTVLHPLAMMWIRSFISSQLSIEYAGYWSGATYISNMLLTVFSMAIATYYLPKISGENCKVKLRNELIFGLKFAIPISVAVLSFIFFAKEIIITLLYTEEYMHISSILGWQLLGDLVKIMSWFFSYFMIAKKMTRQYIISEVFQYVGLCVFTFFLVSFFSLNGVAIAYFINNLIYLIVVFFIFICWYKKDIPAV
ncbi:O-antigen translocase [Aeromonas allosaccharophila]|uniref:O-antigen translocase n=1 Tax=Aeromonas allosaccharophila TaxID=656 RepID=UPI003005BA4B